MEPRNVVRLARSQLKLSATKIRTLILGVPIRTKILGMILLPVLILGVAINYWVRNSLSDWLSWILDPVRVDVAMQAGGRSVMVVTVLAAGLSLLLGSILIVILTNPLLELKSIADQVRGGDLQRRAPVRTRDEIGQVAGSFNRMLDRLAESRSLLSRTNRRLEAMVHVASSVSKGLDLGRVLEAALSSTLDVIGLDSGWIYLREPDGPGFYLASAIQAPKFVMDSLHLTENPCKCQASLLEDANWDDPLLRECLRPTFSNEDAENDPTRHLSVPLQARGWALGVLNLLWIEDAGPTVEELELLHAIGSQISEAVANARMHADLKDKEAGMEILVNQLGRAQEAERSRLSAELHDGSGQELTSLLLRLKAIEDRAQSDRIRDDIQLLCADLSQAIEHLRELSHQLRPPDLDHLGLAPTLRFLVEDMLAETGMQAGFACNLDGQRLDPNVEITLYRIAQEALTNAIRHAQASHLSLSLMRGTDGLQLIVEDNGVGFDPDELALAGNAHIGLASIQERTERMGGYMEVSTGKGQGTKLTVNVPLLEYADA